MKMRTLWVILCVVLFVSSCSGRKIEQYPVIGINDINDVGVYEDHSEVLLRWLKRDFKDVVLVNVDEHDDLRFIPEKKIHKLRKLVEERDWNGIASAHDRGAHSLFTLADFIYAAYRLGIVKKLYWVSPSGFLKWNELQKGAEELLRAFGYPERVIKTFKVENGAVRGRIFGLEVVLTSLENLPEIDEPVLFSIDVDYFYNSIKKQKKGEIDIFREFFKELRNKKIHVMDITVAYSVNGGYTPAVYRYLGDEILELLANPEMASKDNFPLLWRYRQQAMLAYFKGEIETASKTLNEALEKFPQEPSLMAGMVAVLAIEGKHNRALKLLSSLIKQSPRYAYLGIYLGRSLSEKGALVPSLNYIKQFLKIHPNSYYGLMAYGDALYNNAKDQQAFEYYKRILSFYEDVNAYMYAADALFHLKRFQLARQFYHRALLLLKEVGYRSLRDYPESVRNMRYLGMM